MRFRRMLLPVPLGVVQIFLSVTRVACVRCLKQEQKKPRFLLLFLLKVGTFFCCESCQKSTDSRKLRNGRSSSHTRAACCLQQAMMRQHPLHATAGCTVGWLRDRDGEDAAAAVVRHMLMVRFHAFLVACIRTSQDVYSGAMIVHIARCCHFSSRLHATTPCAAR